MRMISPALPSSPKTIRSRALFSPFSSLLSSYPLFISLYSPFFLLLLFSPLTFSVYSLFSPLSLLLIAVLYSLRSFCSYSIFFSFSYKKLISLFMSPLLTSSILLLLLLLLLLFSSSSLFFLIYSVLFSYLSSQSFARVLYFFTISTISNNGLKSKSCKVP